MKDNTTPPGCYRWRRDRGLFGIDDHVRRYRVIRWPARYLGHLPMVDDLLPGWLEVR